MRLKIFHFLFPALLALAIAGCSAFEGSDSKPSEGADEYSEWNVEKFNSEAKKAMDAGNYEKSIKLLETLEARFPFSDYATQAQLDVAYAYFKNDDAESALAAADRFIKINPRSQGIDYAYYLKGLINFNRGIGFIDRYLPTDITQRDQSTSREAFDNFSELLRRYPDSKYVPDAKQRMISLKNNMAMHEIHIAEYYMETRCYVAALDRASNVIEKYQQTPAVPMALQIMQEAYRQMNMTAQADETARIYQLNYPEGLPVTEQANRTVSNKIWDFIGLED